MKTKLLLAFLLICCLGLLAATAPEKYLKLTGGTMTGPIEFGSSGVTVQLVGSNLFISNQLNGGGIVLGNSANGIDIDPLGIVVATGGRRGLPVYPNNAAAVAGGLTVGYEYSTGGDPDVVAIVH